MSLGNTYITHALYAHFSMKWSTYFNLTVATCPPGHVLYSDDLQNYECKCNSDNDQNIIDCLPVQRKLILKVRNTI